MQTDLQIDSLKRMLDSNVRDNAKNYCNNYSVTKEAIVYDDWYLPSKDELNKLFLQMRVIGGFREVCYWSSTETGKYNACSQIFDNGFQTANDKSTTFSVRPIRSF